MSRRELFLFDWKKLFEASGGSPQMITTLLRMLVEKRIPKNKFDAIFPYSETDFSGESFLVHPERLLYNSYKHSFRDIAVYTALASLRPLADYVAYGTITLDPLHAPEEVLQHTDDNRLLEYKDGLLHFIYERSPSKMEIH